MEKASPLHKARCSRGPACPCPCRLTVPEGRSKRDTRTSTSRSATVAGSPGYGRMASTDLDNVTGKDTLRRKVQTPHPHGDGHNLPSFRFLSQAPAQTKLNLPEAHNLTRHSQLVSRVELNLSMHDARLTSTQRTLVVSTKNENANSGEPCRPAGRLNSCPKREPETSNQKRRRAHPRFAQSSPRTRTRTRTRTRGRLLPALQIVDGCEAVSLARGSSPFLVCRLLLSVVWMVPRSDSCQLSGAGLSVSAFASFACDM